MTSREVNKKSSEYTTKPSEILVQTSKIYLRKYAESFFLVSFHHDENKKEEKENKIKCERKKFVFKMCSLYSNKKKIFYGFVSPRKSFNQKIATKHEYRNCQQSNDLQTITGSNVPPSFFFIYLYILFLLFIQFPSLNLSLCCNETPICYIFVRRTSIYAYREYM